MRNLTVKAGVLVIALGLFTACKTSQSSQETQTQNRQGQRGDRPTAAQMLAQMDENKDGKLSKSEVKGPLAENFSDIDTNDDGYISESELENAPKPERRDGERGGGERRGGRM